MKKGLSTVLLLVLLISASQAATYYVDPVSGSDLNDGSSASPKATIPAAIAMTFPAGDVIKLAPGVYEGEGQLLGELTTKLALTIEALDPANRPLIARNDSLQQSWGETECLDLTLRNLDFDGSNAGAVYNTSEALLDIDGGGLTMESVSVTNWRGRGVIYVHSNGGCSEAGYQRPNVYLNDVEIAHNYVVYGTLEYESFSPGIRLYDTDSAVITNCNFHHNTGGDGVVYVGGDDNDLWITDVRISHSSFTYNSAMEHGPACFEINYASWYLNDLHIAHNRATESRFGIRDQYDSVYYISHSEGAVYPGATANTMENIRFENNTASAGTAVGFMKLQQAVTFKNTTLVNVIQPTYRTGMVFSRVDILEFDGFYVDNVRSLGGLTPEGDDRSWEDGNFLTISDYDSLIMNDIRVTDSNAASGNSNHIFITNNRLTPSTATLTDVSFTDTFLGGGNGLGFFTEDGGYHDLTIDNLSFVNCHTDRTHVATFRATGTLRADNILVQGITNTQSSNNFHRTGLLFYTSQDTPQLNLDTSSPNIILSNAVFRDNVANNGGGAFDINKSGPDEVVGVYQINDVQVINCTGVADEGALIYTYEHSHSVSFTDLFLANNSATYGVSSDGYDQHDTRVSHKRTVAIGNKSLRDGGVLWFPSRSHEGIVTIEDSQFIENESTQEHGGAIAAGRGTKLTVTNSQFIRNTAVTGHGGAIFNPAAHEQTYIAGCTFTENSCGDRGGAISVENDESEDYPKLIVAQSTFTDNSGPANSAAHISVIRYGSDRTKAIDVALIDVTVSGGSGREALHFDSVTSVLLDDTVVKDVTTAFSPALWISGVNKTSMTKGTLIVDNHSTNPKAAFLCSASGRVPSPELYMADTVVITNNTASGLLAPGYNMECTECGCTDNCEDCSDPYADLGPLARCSPDLDGTCECLPGGEIDVASGECEGGFFGPQPEPEEEVDGEDDNTDGSTTSSSPLTPVLVGAAAVFALGALILFRGSGNSASSDAMTEKLANPPVPNPPSSHDGSSAGTKSASASLSSGAGRRSSQDTMSTYSELPTDQPSKAAAAAAAGGTLDPSTGSYVPTRRAHLVQAAPEQTVVQSGPRQPRNRSRSRSRGRARGASQQALSSGISVGTNSSGGNSSSSGSYTKAPISVFRGRNDDMQSSGMVSLNSEQAPALDMVSVNTTTTWSGQALIPSMETPAPVQVPGVPGDDTIGDDDVYS